MSEPLDTKSELAVEELSIPGLLRVDLVVNYDDRGSFREAWQAEKMQALGLPEFQPVQWNFSVSCEGVLRGVHAEPWEKFVTVAAGKAYVAYVDLRAGSNFGTTEQFQLAEGQAVFIPRGVGNSFQAVHDTVYGYLVNEHWQPGIAYPAVHAFDPALGIDWPIPEDEALLSDKDQQLPLLIQVEPLSL